MARALERLYQGREHEIIALLAFHYTQSKQTDKALTYLLQAGQQLQATSALKAAIEADPLALTLMSPTTTPLAITSWPSANGSTIKPPSATPRRLTLPPWKV